MIKFIITDKETKEQKILDHMFYDGYTLGFVNRDDTPDETGWVMALSNKDFHEKYELEIHYEE